MKNILGNVVFILSIIAAAYIGLWVMFIDPIFYACSCFDAGMLTGTVIGTTILKCIFASPVAGIIMFIGMLARDYIGDHYE